jgi:serine/threonine protein kinase
MGTVYLARDVRLDRRVALKFLDPERVAGDAGFERRLLHEARAASGLNHPHICQIYDVGGEGTESWIAMEYVEGDSLASIIRARGGLPAEEAVRIGRQIAEALDHAHRRAILHRDLKAANIVCDARGHAKILDFGIASRLPQNVADIVTRTETVVTASPGIEGTLAYMAPEVIRGLAQDERSDLWALGVVLFEMLTGALPFRGANRFELAAAILEGPPAVLPASVPGPLAHIVTRLLSRDPAARYASAAEVAAALDALGGQRGPAAAPARTLPAWSWLVGAALVVVIIGTVLWPRDRRLQLGDQRLISPSSTPQQSPTYSPDGQKIAYAGPDSEGVVQIWVQPLAGGPPIQITSGKTDASRPRWLPGDRILFMLAGQGLWTAPATGGAPSRLSESGANPNVSRDGSRIVFEAQRVIWTAAADGSAVTKVGGVTSPAYVFPMMPALSPDGSMIAYFSAALGPNGDFWVVPSGGGTPRRLTTDLREGGWPVWTRDGRSIIVSSARAGSHTLWQIPIDGGEPSPVTTGAGEDDRPDLSADGKQLAYTNVRNSWDLRVRDLVSGKERVLQQKSVQILFPKFSPDGARITFFGRSDYAVAIFTINADGSDLRQLTGGRELNHQPRWSHDGQSIYFFQHAPTVSFRKIPAVGGPSAEFRPWDWATKTQPFFDPSGGRIAYLRQRGPGEAATVRENTIIQDVASGQETVWPEPHTHPAGWSADGALLLGTQHAPGGANSAVICRVADHDCRIVTTPANTPKWSPNGDRIYFARLARTRRSYELWSVANNGSDEQLISDLGWFPPLDLGFDVSKAGLLTWAPIQTGQSEIWTATIK